MDNKRYKFYKDIHPEWSEEQIWTAVSIDMSAADEIEKGGEDIDINDPNLIAQILRKASNWLAEVLPNVFEKIGKLIDDTIKSIVTWAKNGINYIFEKINEWIG